jgi:hypothetical protein
MIIVLAVWTFLRALLGHSSAVALENIALRPAVPTFALRELGLHDAVHLVREAIGSGPLISPRALRVEVEDRTGVAEVD